MRVFGVVAVLVVLLLGASLTWAGPPAAAQEDFSAIESAIVDATNMERARHGLSSLRPEPALAEASRGHSEEMASLDFFSHQSPTDGRHSLRDRLGLAGVRYVTAGENIAYYQGYGLDQVADRVVTDWMNSPGHRANILCGDFTRLGIGLATGGRKIYVTQDFATLASDSRSDSRPPTRKRFRFRIPILFP